MSDDDGGGERTRTQAADSAAETGTGGSSEEDATTPAGDPEAVTDDAPADTDTAIEAEPASDVDAAADAFVALEGELDAAGATASGRTVGLVVDAATVPADRVPESYPLEPGGGEALALTLDLGDGGETTTYLAWPTDGRVDPDSRLGRLLAATGVPADAFADLYGRQLLVERDGEHDTLYVPPERPQGRGDWSLVVAGGLAFNAAVLGLAALAAAGVTLGGLLPALFVPFLVVTLLVLPWATYRDASYLRSRSDWAQGPLFWAALSMLPGLNVAVSALYLRSRRAAWFFDEEPSLLSRLRRRLRSVGR